MKTRLKPAHIIALLLLTGTTYSLRATPAFGYREPSTNQTTGSVCDGCHQSSPVVDGDCQTCHTFVNGHFPFSSSSATYPDTTLSWKGPHGTYDESTDRCTMCHTVHDAPTGVDLLPGTTITATCFSCHDGTGGYGVYGAIAARGLTPGGGHSVDTTAVVPGGSAATGGPSTVSFGGVGGTLTCSDCHSPHDSQTVNKFLGERLRVRDAIEVPYSNRLLKQTPTGGTAGVSVYGSDWCMACHGGRASGGMVVNHPVDSLLTTTSPFHYERVVVYYGAVDATIQPLTTLGSVGGVGGPVASTHWYAPAGSTVLDIKHWGSHLMPFPRVPLQQGHAPICQQCHEDTRYAGELTADGTGVITALEDVRGKPLFKYGYADGETSTVSVPNPRFQNFPHETQNPYMLVEAGDDLCTNCHPPAALP